MTRRPVKEIALVERTKRLLHGIGAEVIKTHGSSLRQGEPDLIGCYRGRFIAVEMKVPGFTPEPIQEARLRRWERAGAIAFWSDDPEAVVRRVQDETS